MAQNDGWLFREYLYTMLGGEHDLSVSGDTCNVALMDGALPDQNTYTAWANTNECTDGGGDVAYTTRGDVLTPGDNLTGKATVLEGALTNLTDAAWLTLLLNETPTNAQLFNTTASDIPVGYWQVQTATNNGNYTIEWPAKILTLTAAGFA